jgi:hypothetical protein
MAGLLEFAARFGTEERCIEHLAGLRWPDRDTTWTAGYQSTDRFGGR